MKDKSCANGIENSARKSPNTFEMLTAAEADEKNPAKVIPTWIDDRNFDGSFKISSINFALLSPSSAFEDNLYLSAETIAISEAAKKALIKVKININTSLPIILDSLSAKFNTPLIFFYIYSHD